MDDHGRHSGGRLAGRRLHHGKEHHTRARGTEQLLLSTAADRATRAAGLEIFAGRKVFLDTRYFESYDSKYQSALPHGDQQRG